MVSFVIVGFVSKNGHAAKKDRDFFGKLFQAKNILAMFPKLNEKIQKHVNRMKDKIIKEHNASLEIEFKQDFLMPMFNEITNLILFGIDDPAHFPKFGGISYGQFANNMWMNVIKLLYHKANFYTFGLAEKLNLVKEKQDFLNQQKLLRKCVLKYYYNQESIDAIDKNCISLLNLIKNHNKNMEKEGNTKEILSDDFIAESFELFQTGATETSFHTTTNLFKYLTTDKVTQQRIYEEMDENFEEISQKYEKIRKLKQLDYAFREALRIYHPFPLTIPRIATKNFTLAGKKIYKGTLINLNHWGSST